MNWKNKVVSITPFVCAIVFFILWHFGFAHPGWIVFLLIPLMPFLVGKKKMSVSVIVIIIYLITSFILKDKWGITWVILLTIPIINILLIPSGNKKGKIDRFDDFDEVE